jgi:NAD(P)-dependent dehydrogenase (short-subunit alcohol dehydrogenase family)
MPTVLITGANRGIGLELTRQYFARGDTVIATARDPAAAKALNDLKAQSEGRLTISALDVTSEKSFAALVAAIAAPLDIVVCNAGMNGGRGGVEDPSQTMALWADLLVTNVTGPFFTARAFASHLAKAKGKIGIISSRMGSSTAAAGNSYAYRASKAAASNIAANLAVELKPKGIAVASYHPGWVKTDMGGQGADIDATTSAKGLVARIDALSLATTGAFENYSGPAIPF